MDVRVVFPWDLERTWFTNGIYEWRKIEGQYVSDGLKSKDIDAWLEGSMGNFFNNLEITPFQHTDSLSPEETQVAQHKMPVFIKAQTGKGKNYFVKHTLREALLWYGSASKILYVCNRIALLNQELSSLRNELNAPDLRVSDEELIVGTITFVTYNKLLAMMNTQGKSFQHYSCVVFDECHFFYSDAMFNETAEKLLPKIPTHFSTSVRIYMSATPENVIVPILKAELEYTKHLLNYLKDKIYTTEVTNQWYERIWAYTSAYDYSAYECTFFDPVHSQQNLIEEILDSKDKWLIFVTNIRKGKELAQQLCAANKKRLKPGKKASAGKYALFLDRKSRYNTDEVSGKMWAKIEKNMSFSPHVLITTSVLDNGITLNDKNLKNIVLYTDDRTEFIQEIGRCRVNGRKAPHLYISKCTLHMRKREIGMMMGILQKLRDTKDPSGCNLGVVNSLWTAHANEARSLVLMSLDNNGLNAKLNNLAAWHLEKENESLQAFLEMEKEYPEDFRVRYKAQWLNKTVEDVQDLDKESTYSKSEKGIQELESFLCSCCSTHALYESGSQEFVEFSRTIYSLFRKIKPSSTNYSREYWKSGAVIRKKLESESVSYTLEEVPAYELPKKTGKQSARSTGNQAKIITWRVIRKKLFK